MGRPENPLSKPIGSDWGAIDRHWIGKYNCWLYSCIGLCGNCACFLGILVSLTNLDFVFLFMQMFVHCWDCLKIEPTKESIRKSINQRLTFKHFVQVGKISLLEFWEIASCRSFIPTKPPLGDGKGRDIIPFGQIWFFAEVFAHLAQELCDEWLVLLGKCHAPHCWAWGTALEPCTTWISEAFHAGMVRTGGYLSWFLLEGCVSSSNLRTKI